jgi:hypothetical protein
VVRRACGLVVDPAANQAHPGGHGGRSSHCVFRGSNRMVRIVSAMPVHPGEGIL